MNDPTKNLPWRVKWEEGDELEFRCGGYRVLDSLGQFVCRFDVWGATTKGQAEFLARMVAAGSVAGELYAACEVAVSRLCHKSDTNSYTVYGVCNDALALAAPILEPTKETR